MYHQAVRNLTAYVLAGGKSSRMGQDKALLLLDGKTLLERALALAVSIAGEAWIVGGSDRFFRFGQTIEDKYPDSGPLGGIHAALSLSATDMNLFLAVDMPFVEAVFLHYLIAQASQSAAVVTLPQTDGRWQPLCAVYRREFAPVAEAALKKGRNKIDALFGHVEVRAIQDEEMSRMNFSSAMFRNLNTPGDLKSASRFLAG